MKFCRKGYQPQPGTGLLRYTKSEIKLPDPDSPVLVTISDKLVRKFNKANNEEAVKKVFQHKRLTVQSVWVGRQVIDYERRRTVSVACPPEGIPVKHPILVNDILVLVGFRESD